MTYIITLPVGYKPVLKHGDHDQSSHGSWATGITEELSNWSPKDSVPASPRNAGGMTQKIWDNWEHGVDGYQYVELYRQYAGEALGIAVPQSDMDTGGQLNYLTTRGFGGSSTDAARNQAEAMLKAIANGKPEQPALYRGMVATDEVSQELIKGITSLKAGDTLDMPLVSTSRSLGVATWYAVDRNKSGTDSVIMKIQPGAKGVSLSADKSRYPQDHEVVTSGKFEVVGITKIQTPYWERGIIEPRKINYTDGRPSTYEVATYSSRRYNPEESKKIYEDVTNGRYDSLETPNFKVTNDRGNVPNYPKVSTWEKQPAKEVTVVEVKFVDSHVVKKAEAKDYGLTFDALFNDVPFIRDEEEVAKHGDHDQSSHGAWASGIMNDLVTLGNFNEEELGESSQNLYFETYGIKTDGSKEPVGISRNQIQSLDFYTGEGYTKINAFLRGKGDTEGESLVDIDRRVPELDKLIEDSPELFGDKNLYRVFDKNLVDTLKEGDILTDKGFMSTTRVDITSDEGLEVLQNLQLIRLTEDRASIILPSESKKGKGLAVDYLKNSVSDLFTNVATANNEKEVLLPRNTSLKFQGYKKLNEGTDNAMEIAVFQRMDK